MVISARVPDVIHAGPRGRRVRASPGVALDPGEAALDLPPAPPPPPATRGFHPMVVAVFGGMFGLAAIASVIAVLIQLDGPSRTFGPVGSGSAPPASPPSPLAAVAPQSTTAAPTPTPPPDAPAEPLPGPWRISALAGDDSVKMVTGKLGTRSLMDALEEEHVPKPQIFRILKAFDDPKVFDKPRKSHQYAVALDRATKRVKAFEYQASMVDVWQAKEGEEGALAGQKLDMKVEVRRVAKAVVVKEDLKASVVEAGFDDDILDSLDDALEDRMSRGRFGKGSTLRIVAQEQTVYGRFARYVDIEAVEYHTPKSDKASRVYHYRAGKNSGFYDEHGKAPYKGGWRAPLKLPRVTSRFNPKRLHPVLHTVMPHNGVDFGAPSGTPVFAASHGTVGHVGPHGPSGNLVLIDHGNGLETGYAHLSRFAPGIKAGDKVETRQLVGFVGSTGRSTGPHLHFSLKKNGQFVDPLSTLKMDGERVIPKGERDGFDAFKAEMDKILDAVPLPDRPPGTAAPVDDDDDKDTPGEGEEEPGAPPTPAPHDAPPAAAPTPAPAKKDDENVGSAVWNPLLLRLGRRQPDRAAHARPAEPAVPVGVLREVLLVVVLGVVEVGRVEDLGRDVAVPRLAEGALVGRTRTLGRRLLRLAEHIDARAVLRADVVALAHPFGGVVALPEHLEQLLVGDASRIEDDEHDLVVPGHSAAHLAIRRVRREAGGVPDRGRDHPGRVPEFLLGAPEAPEAEDGLLGSCGEGRHDPRAVHEVGLGDGHSFGAAWQSFGGRREAQFLRREQHGARIVEDAGAIGQPAPWLVRSVP
jgi:murein DD-endopeptidase MepM/ murein hydrolase activator NlpD